MGKKLKFLCSHISVRAQSAYLGVASHSELLQLAHAGHIVPIDICPGLLWAELVLLAYFVGSRYRSFFFRHLLERHQSIRSRGLC